MATGESFPASRGQRLSSCRGGGAGREKGQLGTGAHRTKNEEVVHITKICIH